ncbi:hypothetical protein GCM10012285_17010 [Streptomyces kronopolitis]|uniref:Uncharacterized protein n=1 Tax=Streptomyces kronopolitis TaxID=1612435 RepID=A0ABQ2J751_9ACTN|nr:hypothetical protein GCM10012285_17010 [Streptomyces kronopolitis]
MRCLPGTAYDAGARPARGASPSYAAHPGGASRAAVRLAGEALPRPPRNMPERSGEGARQPEPPAAPASHARVTRSHMNTLRKIFAHAMPQTGVLSGSLEGEGNRSPAAGPPRRPMAEHGNRNEDGS